MPFKDGYEATKDMRKMWTKQGIIKDNQPTIIAVTGHVEEEYVRKATDSGMNQVFPKPFPIKEFGKLLIDCNYLKEMPRNLRLDNDSD